MFFPQTVYTYLQDSYDSYKNSDCFIKTNNTDVSNEEVLYFP
jgi:hypothetical protein